MDTSTTSVPTVSHSMDYQDAIMLTEEARLIIRKIDDRDDDVDDRQRKHAIDLARMLYLRALDIQERVSGWCSEDIAVIYYELGWLEYEYTLQYERALGYLLQSLRISHHLSGEDHPTTRMVLDDIQDLLEDMDLDNEYGNRIFQSWELQDVADDLLTDARNDARDDEDALSPALGLYQQALEKLPAKGVELEQAHIYTRMASLAARLRLGEDALSYYFSALLRLPNWFTRDHPRIRALTKESKKVAREQLTPICGRPQLQEREQEAAYWRNLSTNGRKSYATAFPLVANE